MSDDLNLMAAELRMLRTRIERLERLETPRFIGARYTTNAGQSLPNDLYTVVNYDDIDYDPLGLVAPGAGWAFTCPLAGAYAVSAAVLFDVSAGWAGRVAALLLQRNGVGVCHLDRRDGLSGSGHYQRAAGDTTVWCQAGDTLRVLAFQNTGVGLALYSGAGAETFQYVSITRLR